MARSQKTDRNAVLKERLLQIGQELTNKRRPGWISDHLRKEQARLREELRWWEQPEPCTGPGYAHGAHGACPGYGRDRT